MCFDCLTICNQTVVSCVFEETRTLTLTRSQTNSKSLKSMYGIAFDLKKNNYINYKFLINILRILSGIDVKIYIFKLRQYVDNSTKTNGVLIGEAMKGAQQKN